MSVILVTRHQIHGLIMWLLDVYLNKNHQKLNDIKIPFSQFLNS